MWVCKGCGEEQDDNYEVCWNCDTIKDGVELEETDYEDSLIFSTTSSLETHYIRKYLGIVSGETILGANIISDFFAGVTDIVGGRSGTYEDYLREARQSALATVGQRAIGIKANAVIGVKFDYETIRGSMLMVTCTGTAVVVEAKDDTKPAK